MVIEPELLLVQVAELARLGREALWPRVRLVLGALERPSAERPGRLPGVPQQVVLLPDGPEI